MHIRNWLRSRNYGRISIDYPGSVRRQHLLVVGTLLSIM